MATHLKDLKITSTDLVDAGANPDAHIRLFKRDGETENETLLRKAVSALAAALGMGAPVTKTAATFDEKATLDLLRDLAGEAWSFNYTLSESLSSIICDTDLDEDGKREKMFQSLDEFAEVLRRSIPLWAAGKSANDGATVEKSTAQNVAFGEMIAKYINIDGGQPPETIEKSQKEEDMNIDKSRLTPEELAALEAIEKKYGTERPPESMVTDVEKGTEVPELHPEVKKALEENKAMAAQMEELQKSLEVKDLSIFAKKYEVLGKNADELAPKLYDLKKAGGTVYDDFVAVLDEQLTLVEKSGLFRELGSGRGMGGAGGGELDAKATEIRKNNPEMTQPEALAKAYEENPDLAAQYESNYGGGK